MEGDRTLACWMSNESLIFATYSLGLNDSMSDLNIEH